LDENNYEYRNKERRVPFVELQKISLYQEDLGNTKYKTKMDNIRGFQFQVLSLYNYFVENEK